MNKKFLSAILFGAFMVGSSVTFTGCIDNDEPAGIEELRGAKAELIKAKVAVEAANAAYVTAQAEKVKAEAEVSKIQAEVQKLILEEQRLKVEYQQIQNEEAKANLEKQIQENKLALEKAALEHEAAMWGLKQSLAEAKRAYELAIKQIEIAEALGSEADKVYIHQLKSDVSNAQYNVENATLAVENAELNYNQAVLNAKLNSRVDSVTWKGYELNLRDAKAELKIAEETLAKWQSFLENDTETATWRKEVTAIEDTIKVLEKKKVELTVELSKLQNAEEYKALIDAKNKTAYDFNNLATTADLAYEDLMADKKTVTKGTLVTTALENIAGVNWKNNTNGGYIAYWNGKLAKYTSQYQALLDEVAADYTAEVAEAKKAADKAVADWKAAKEKYDAVGDYDAAKAKTTVTTAGTTFDAAMTAAAGDATKELAALNAYAKALVTYYDNAEKYVGCVTNKVKLSIAQPDGTTKEVERTIYAWLSDASYSGMYLDMLIDKGNATSYFYTVGGAIKTMGDANDIYQALVTASTNAFGTASLYGHLIDGVDVEKNYMRVEPTEAELKAVGYPGALGNYYWLALPSTQYEANNYKDIMADYQKAVTYWTEQHTALKKAYTDAETAKDAAVDALEAYEDDNFDAIQREINGEIQGRIEALKRIKEALCDAIEVYIDGVSIYDTTENFTAWLDRVIKQAERNVLNKENMVVLYENVLIEIKESVQPDLVSISKKLLDNAMVDLEEAQAELETALANLAKGLEIMAGTSAE